MKLTFLTIAVLFTVVESGKKRLLLDQVYIWQIEFVDTVYRLIQTTYDLF